MKCVLLILALACVATPAFAQQDSVPEENPMEEMGVLHNAYLGCLMKQDPEMQLNSLRVLVERCGLSVKGDPEAFIEEAGRLLPPDPLASWDDKLAPYHGLFNEQQQSFLDQLEAILSRTDATALQIAKSLSGLGIRASDELGREQADLAVLAAISVASHSLQFWTSEEHDTAGLRGVEARRRPWWKVLFVVTGDAAGALIGTAVAPGPGTVGIAAAASQGVGTAIAHD